MTVRNRFLAFLTALGLVAQMVPAYALAFSDVKASTNYEVAIDALQTKGVLQGYADGTFKPTAHINRAEFMKIIMGSLGVSATATAKNCFPDVTTQWFAAYICTANAQGIVAGYPDGLFHPERDINFVEASKILSIAYKQQVQQTGGEWYQPYALALESSKAIPPTVAKLDAAITRGEMAEMMWRVSTGNTSQPTKGLLNLQYPALTVNTASDKVQYASSCTDLQAFAASAQASGPNVYMRGGGMMEDKAGGVMAPMAPTANQSANSDYSHTNVQVQGVDESDIVKTDGTYLYAVSTTTKPVVRIIRATPAASMALVSTIDLTNDNFTPNELYVDNGTLIIMGQTGYWNGNPGPIPMGATKMMAPSYMPIRAQQTQVRIYDVSNPATPTLSRSVSFDGNSISSRRIGGKLYLVLQQPYYLWMDPMIKTPTQVVPQFEDSKIGKTMDVAPCNKIAILPHVPSPEYMTIAVVPTDDLSATVKTSVVLGSAQNVYASLNNLYVATTQWNYIWDSAHSESQEKTHIFRFAFSDNGVDLKAQGDVPGHILNQFSMDENGSTFRIATTEQWWNSTEEKSTNSVYVLNMDLTQTGSVKDLAPGETIYSVRFAGDRAYLVTFKQIDPFFVIDLSDPRAPKVLGNLKIPGFSNYLEPYDATHVIGFGKDADPSIDADKVHSTDAIYYTAVQGLKLALFDVSDVNNPKQLAVEIIGDRGSDSPVLINHKALLFEKDRNLLALPVLVTKRPDGSPASADGNPVFQGAYVYTLTPAGGFVLRGKITHYDNTDAFLKSGTYWSGGAQDIQRIVRIGSSLVTLSDAKVQSHTETTVQKEGSVDLK